MILIYIFLVLNIIAEIYGKQVYVPTLIWTSREFQGRKNVDYLVLKKVKSDLFEAYFMELLANRKPLVVVFLENDLSTDDFEWKSDDGYNSFPFLSKLTVDSRVDYFRNVESPYKTIAQLQRKGYKFRHLKPGMNFDFNEGELLLVEFQKIKDRRPETIKKHDAQIEEIHQQLANSGTKWISIYTARNTNSKACLLDLKQMSPWHVAETFPEKTSAAISLYQDEFTGFTLITKGSIQLLLPSPRNLVVKNLENYLVASAKPSVNGMDFVIWFANYSVTFHMVQSRENWIIKEAKLLNENGDSLNLTPGKQDILLDNKCYAQFTEFQSEGKPLVKIIVSKYKFLQLELHEEPCKKPYAFHMTFSLIFISIVSTIICWNKLLENLDFSTKAKRSVKVYSENFHSLKTKVIL